MTTGAGLYRRALRACRAFPVAALRAALRRTVRDAAEIERLAAHPARPAARESDGILLSDWSGMRSNERGREERSAAAAAAAAARRTPLTSAAVSARVSAEMEEFLRKSGRAATEQPRGSADVERAVAALEKLAALTPAQAAALLQRDAPLATP